MLTQKYPLHKLNHIQWPLNFTHGPIPKLLEASIRRIGVLNPIQINEANPLMLITGKRRLTIARQLKLKTIPARILKNISHFDAFQISLNENITHRILHCLEKAHILYLLKNRFHLSNDDLLQQYCPLLSIPAKDTLINDYNQIHQSSEILKSSLLNDIITFESASRLVLFPEDQHQILIQTIQNLKLGCNSQKELLLLCFEIWKKDECNMNTLLQESFITDILSRNEWSEKQRWLKLQYQLMLKRFPHLMSLEEEFNKIKKGLFIPPRLSLQHSPFFESDDYKINCSFKSTEELHIHIACLQKLLESNECEKLFKLTGNEKSEKSLPT